MSNYTLYIIIVNGPTLEHYFDDITSNNTKMCLEVMFWLVFFFAISRTRFFSQSHSHYNFRVLFYLLGFFKNLKKRLDRFF